MTAREGVEGSGVAGVEELRTGALEGALQDGGEDEASDRGAREQRRGDSGTLAVESARRQSQEREDYPIVAQSGDEEHRLVESVGEVIVDKEQYCIVEPAALAFDDVLDYLGAEDDDAQGEQEAQRQSDSERQPKPAREAATDLFGSNSFESMEGFYSGVAAAGRV